jgi:hypothetical protein
LNQDNTNNQNTTTITSKSSNTNNDSIQSAKSSLSTSSQKARIITFHGVHHETTTEQITIHTSNQNMLTNHNGNNLQSR